MVRAGLEKTHNGEIIRIMVPVIMGHPHIMSPSVTPTHDMNECVDCLFIFSCYRASIAVFLAYAT